MRQFMQQRGVVRLAAFKLLQVRHHHQVGRGFVIRFRLAAMAQRHVHYSS